MPSSTDSYSPIRIVTVFYDKEAKTFDDTTKLSPHLQRSFNSMIEALDVRVTSRSQYVESDTGFACTLTIYDPNTIAGEDFIEHVASNSRFDIAFGYETEAVFEFYKMQVISMKYEIDEGLRIKIEAVTFAESRAILLSPAMAGLSYSNKTASEIIRDLAERFEWDTKLPDGRPSIVDSNVRIPGPLNWDKSTYKQIASWVKNEVVKYGRDSTKEPFEFYLDRNGAVHFHPASYIADRAPVVRFDTRSPDGEVLSCSFNEDSVFVALHGYQSTKLVSSDADKGIVQENVSSIGDAQKTRPQSPAGNGTTVPAAVVGGAEEHVRGRRSQEDVDAEMNARHRFLSRRPMRVEMSVIGTNGVTFLGNIQVIHRRPDGANSWLSGTYQVVSLEHRLDHGAWQTKITGFRSAFSQNDPPVKATNAALAAVGTAKNPLKLSPATASQVREGLVVEWGGFLFDVQKAPPAYDPLGDFKEMVGLTEPQPFNPFAGTAAEAHFIIKPAKPTLVLSPRKKDE